MPEDVCGPHHAFCRNCGNEGAGHGPYDKEKCDFFKLVFNVTKCRARAERLAWPEARLRDTYKGYNAKKAVEAAINRNKAETEGRRAGPATSSAFIEEIEVDDEQVHMDAHLESDGLEYEDADEFFKGTRSSQIQNWSQDL